jgi:hypothetical protein
MMLLPGTVPGTVTGTVRYGTSVPGTVLYVRAAWKELEFL